MQTDKQTNQYQQISFHKKYSEDQSNKNQKDAKSFSEQLQNQVPTDKLIDRIFYLQKQLHKQREKSSQLQKRNQQLTDMLVSASQSSVKRNQHFIKQIERKIYNCKALKDLNSSTIKSSKVDEQKQYKSRVMTQSNYQSTKSSLPTNKEPYSSNSKFDSNKENTNIINQKVNTNNQFFFKSKYNHQNQDSNTYYSRNKENLFKRNIQKEIQNSIPKGYNKVNIHDKGSILSSFPKNNDLKIFNKIQNKLRRI